MRIFSFLSLTLLFLCACSRTDLREYPSDSGYQLHKSSDTRLSSGFPLSYEDLLGEWQGTNLVGSKAKVIFEKVGYSIREISKSGAIRVVLNGSSARMTYGEGYFQAKEQGYDVTYNVKALMKDYNTLQLSVQTTSNTGKLLFNSNHSYILKRKIPKDIPVRPKRGPIDPPNTVYRRDTRDPEEIFQSGFHPRGSNDDLIAHVSGVSLYYPGVALSGWVSTTASFQWSRRPYSPMPNDEFWVYNIVPGPNLYSVVGTFEYYLRGGITSRPQEYLQRLISMYGDQYEWAALGSIPPDRIRRATHFRFDRLLGEYIQGEIRENPGYDRGSVPSASSYPYIPVSISAFSSSGQYYRADIRPPEQIIQQGGIVGDDELDIPFLSWGPNLGDVNLYRHSRSPNRDGYGYLSLNDRLGTAHLTGTALFGSGYYIYVVTAGPNIFSTSEILGQYRDREYQYSALGGIPLLQIAGWFRVAGGHIVGEMTDNPSYRPRLFDGLGIIDGTAGYPFAGFPAGHPAWTRYPWADFAPGGCVRTDFRRSANVTSRCDKQTTLVSRDYLRNLIEYWIGKGSSKPR